jgi:hypothetical protein
MPVDPDVHVANRAASDRIRRVAASIADDRVDARVGEHWTPGVVFAHLAFWDRRVQLTLDATEAAGAVVVVDVDIAANDISLPLWLAVPPRDAMRLAVETASDLDERLAALDPAILEALHDAMPRWVRRHLHRNEHLDELEAALSPA